MIPAPLCVFLPLRPQATPVACDLHSTPRCFLSNDKQPLLPMLQQVIENVNGKPQVASADTGYWSAAHATAENLQGIDLYVATER
jgi:hypothetical protein